MAKVKTEMPEPILQTANNAPLVNRLVIPPRCRQPLNDMTLRVAQEPQVVQKSLRLVFVRLNEMSKNR